MNFNSRTIILMEVTKVFSKKFEKFISFTLLTKVGIQNKNKVLLSMVDPISFCLWIIDHVINKFELLSSYNINHVYLSSQKGLGLELWAVKHQGRNAISLDAIVPPYDIIRFPSKYFYHNFCFKMCLISIGITWYFNMVEPH